MVIVNKGYFVVAVRRLLIVVASFVADHRVSALWTSVAVTHGPQ